MVGYSLRMYVRCALPSQRYSVRLKCSLLHLRQPHCRPSEGKSQDRELRRIAATTFARFSSPSNPIACPPILAISFTPSVMRRRH